MKDSTETPGPSSSLAKIEDEEKRIIGSPEDLFPKTSALSGRVTDSDMRAVIAFLLIGIFVTTNLGIGGLGIWEVLHGGTLDGVKALAELLLPTQGTLMGTAIGFYFADTRRRQ